MDDETIGMLIIIAGFALYFLPTIVAEFRKHRQATPIFIVNLFLGWTLVGWVLTLAWAFMSDAQRQT